MENNVRKLVSEYFSVSDVISVGVFDKRVIVTLDKNLEESSKVIELKNKLQELVKDKKV